MFSNWTVETVETVETTYHKAASPAKLQIFIYLVVKTTKTLDVLFRCIS